MIRRIFKRLKRNRGSRVHVTLSEWALEHVTETGQSSTDTGSSYRKGERRGPASSPKRLWLHCTETRRRSEGRMGALLWGRRRERPREGDGNDPEAGEALPRGWGAGRSAGRGARSCCGPFSAASLPSRPLRLED